MIYFDNAATFWPKPAAVGQAISRFLETSAGNPGRSGHRMSLAAARIVYNLREALAEFFGLEDPLRLVFTSGATESINLALRGLLRPGDHVVTSSLEHNAVMRPLRALEREGVRLSVVACGADGSLSPRAVAAALRPETRLVVLNHASNVSGTILPIAEVGEITRREGKLLLVDAAQTAGVLPINMKQMNVDLLAFSGHKGLLGPTGIGGLAIGEHVDVREMTPLKRGGTGSRSEFEEQPDFLPDKYEAGTPNSVGIAGLAASLDYLREHGVEALRRHEIALTRQLIDGLRAMPGIQLLGPCDPARQVAVVSFTVAGWHVSEVALRLDEAHGILCRPGLHCAPAAHHALGSFPEGTVRFSPGPFNTSKDVEEALEAVLRLGRRPV